MINTKRFYLRKFKITDAENMFNNWANDSEVTKYLTWQPHKSVEASLEFIKFLIDTNKTDLAICDRISGEVIGSIANVKENADFSACEIGYCLSRKYWNQGVMTEVLDAYLDDLFNNKNYKVVEAEHMVENVASGAVMIKCGFRFNYNAEVLTEKHGWVNVKHYSITKEEYLMHKLQLLLNSFLNSKIPLFSTLNQTINYLSNNGYLVNVVNTICDSKVRYKSIDDVLVIKKSEYNINSYYFIGKSNKKILFKKYVKDFLDINDLFILSEGNVSVEEVLVKILIKHNLTISFAESCTGGLMAATLINVSGASSVLKESYVTYSDDAKNKILGVNKNTIDEFSVYSKETAFEMAKGLSMVSKSNVCVSITGLAGGSSYQPGDGSYHSCIIVNYNDKEVVVELDKHEKGTRNDVRRKQVNYVFYQVIKVLRGIL